MPAKDNNLRIIIETIYKALGVTSAKKDFAQLGGVSDESGKKIGRLASNMGSLKSRVDNLHNSLSKATPKNLEYAKTFEKIQKDLNKGKISISEAKSEVEKLKTEMDAAEPSTNLLSKALSKVGVAALALKGLKFAFDLAKDATLLTARVETLAIVTETLGGNVGKTVDEIRDLEASIQAQGITTQASRQAVAQMIQANLDLANATDIARLAQDAAVISGENSSQAFEALVTVIATGNTLMARRRGLMVNFQSAYESWADAQGRTVDSLTEEEKVLIRTNEVLEQGVNIAGAYEAAMETAGKKLTSMPRYWEEFKLSVGEDFQGVFGGVLDAVAQILKDTNEQFKVEEQIVALHKQGVIDYGERARLMRTFSHNVDEATKYLEDLAAVEKGYKDIMGGNIKTYGEYLDVYKSLIPYMREYGIHIPIMSRETWDNNVALQAQVDTITLLQNAEEGYLKVSLDKLKIDNLSLHYAEEHIRVNSKQVALWQEMAQAEWYLAMNARENIGHQLRMQQALRGTYNEMTQFDDIFSGTRWEARTQASGKFAEHIMSQLDRFSSLDRYGERNTQMFELYFDALDKLDPKMAKAMRTSQLFNQYMDALFSAMESGQISTTEFADAVDDMSRSFSRKDPFDALKDAMDELLEKTGYVAPEVKEQWATSLSGGLESMMEEGLLDDIFGDIEAIRDAADDSKLEMTDNASPVLDPVLDKIDKYTGEHIATLTTYYKEVGSPPGGGGGETEFSFTPFSSALMNPAVGRVPGGHPNDTFGIGLRTGEDYAVWKSGDAPPVGNITHISIPVSIGEVSSEVDIDNLLTLIGERIKETRI